MLKKIQVFGAVVGGVCLVGFGAASFAQEQVRERSRSLEDSAAPVSPTDSGVVEDSGVDGDSGGGGEDTGLISHEAADGTMYGDCSGKKSGDRCGNGKSWGPGTGPDGIYYTFGWCEECAGTFANPNVLQCTTFSVFTCAY